MKIKIIGILVSMLLIAATVLPVLATVNIATEPPKEHLKVEVYPPALLVCKNTTIRIVITDGHNNLVSNATIYIDSRKINGGCGIVKTWYHANETEIPAGVYIRVEKEGYDPGEVKIKVFKERSELYKLIMNAYKFFLDLIKLLSKGGKLPFNETNAQIVSWVGNIRLPNGDVYEEVATSMEGKIYVQAVDPETDLASVNFTELNITFAPSVWGGLYTGPSIAVLDHSYPSAGLFNLSTGEIMMNFQTMLTNDILVEPLVELGWFNGSFDNNTGLLTINGSSGIIYWPAPEIPTIVGPTSGKVGIEYDFNFSSTDPKEGDVYYYIDWGDGTTSEWIGPYASGEEIKASHTWDMKGTYKIKAKARDCFGEESNWATLTISMPKNK